VLADILSGQTAR